MKTFYSKFGVLGAIGLALLSTGCSATGGGTIYSETQYIRNTQGQTVARIRDGNVYQPNGVRTHRIDSTGNIYSVRGANAGQRVGRIAK